MSYVHGFQIDASHSLHIFRGSLTEVEADALVSSDDNYLSAGGGVSAALARAAGRQVERERQELVLQPHPRLGDVVRTSAGALPCNHLYHAITIDRYRGKRMDEASLRLLVANLLDRATADGVQSLGIPALGTGAAFFDLGRAAEIIIGELLERVVKTHVSRVVLALLGDHAERLFYEELVRSRADSCAVQALRHRESILNKKTDGRRTVEDRTAAAETAAVDEMIEQFPNLVDEASLAAAPAERPRLVAGLAEMILKYAPAKDVEQELLTLPACRDFRGPLQARLMEFLYLSEGNLRIALGPALFRSRDLRNMAAELGVDVEIHRDHEQLIAGILRALCFNPVVPPVGITSYLARLEELCAGVRRDPEPAMQIVMHAAIEAGQILERVLTDLLRLYGSFFWGTSSLAEMVQRNIVPARRDADPLCRLTIGQAKEAILALGRLVKQEPELREKLRQLGRENDVLLPLRVPGNSTAAELDVEQVLGDVIRLRNAMTHDRDEHRDREQAADPNQFLEVADHLAAFLVACQRGSYYPEVLRYDGTYENRDGERFVYFVDERGKSRTVRTNERIDARRHYYCFATNNPVYLFPTLIPKT